MPIILQESSGACGDDRIQGINTGIVAGELALIVSLVVISSHRCLRTLIRENTRAKKALCAMHRSFLYVDLYLFVLSASITD